MMDLLLYNAKIYNCPEFDIVGIKDGKIILLECSEKIDSSLFLSLQTEAKNAINLKNKWLTPGLIDCHTHLIFGGSRANEFSARLAGASYEEITRNGGGINSTVSQTRNASLDELKKIAENRIKQIIAQGVTTIEIKSGYGLSLESEKKILQVAKYLENHYPITIQKTFLGAHVVPNLPGEQKITAQEYIKYLCDEVLPDLYHNQLVDAVDGFCEKIAFSAEELIPLYEKAQEYNLKIKGHTEQLSKIGGAELICHFNGVSCDHLEYANEDIIKLMKKTNTAAVLLPGAYYYLNETTKPPVELFRQYNIPIAIATDFNPGTSPILSLPIIMNMACVLYKLTPAEAWDAVTINAAIALGLEHRVGSIEIGKQADLIIWNFDHPHDLCYFMGYEWEKVIIQNGKIISEMIQENYD